MAVEKQRWAGAAAAKACLSIVGRRADAIVQVVIDVALLYIDTEDVRKHLVDV